MMKRRDFLVGGVAVVAASVLKLPSMAAVLKPIEPVEKEDYNVKYSDALWELGNIRHRFGNSFAARSQAMKSILDRHWEQSRLEGKNLHLYVDMKLMADRINETRYHPATYIADKVSVINPDGTYRMIKNRNRINMAL
jgi:hypothetical protein